MTDDELARIEQDEKVVEPDEVRALVAEVRRLKEVLSRRDAQLVDVFSELQRIVRETGYRPTEEVK